MSTTALIADDHALLRQGLRLLLLDEWPELTVAEAESLDTALEQLAGTPADLILIDLSMPGMAGAESLRALRESYPDTKVVVITGDSSRGSILDCLAAGIHGYVLKSGPVESTVQAIRTVLGGELYIAPALANVGAAQLARSEQGGAGTGADTPHFTPRQLDVLHLLGEGHSTKEIARRLDLGIGTVKIHLAAIFQKLNARNRTEAAVLAARFRQ